MDISVIYAVETPEKEEGMSEAEKKTTSNVCLDHGLQVWDNGRGQKTGQSEWRAPTEDTYRQR
jgi:hypothetical protein